MINLTNSTHIQPCTFHYAVGAFLEPRGLRVLCLRFAAGLDTFDVTSSLFDIVQPEVLLTSCVAVGTEGASRLGILSLTPEFDSIALTNVLVKQFRAIRFTYTGFTTVEDTGAILEETGAAFGKDGSGTTVGNDIGATAGITAGPTVGTTAGILAEATAGTIGGITAGRTAGMTAGIPAEATAGTTAGIMAWPTAGTIVGLTLGATAGMTVGITAGPTAGTIVGLTLGAMEGTIVVVGT